MKLFEITPDIVQLTRFGLVNCFLVREDDGLTLVDTMVGGSAKGIYAAASSLNRSLRRILLTHVHGDHAGSLDVLSNKLVGIEVAVGRRESRLLTRDFRSEPGEAPARVRGSFPKVETIPSALLSDGENYGSLIVIATPGHTPGHLSFLDQRSGTLIAGDALANVGELRVTGDCPAVFPLPNWGTWHTPTAVESARKLMTLEPKKIVVGHGKPVTENASQLLKEAIRHAEG
ncbi:MAG TPA: MBL fold metallo-hydrolase [Silvibacterium sp.]|jgi:glyoxylase-like metal-dependent hydrolase (beta-lactamase superfamily II)|nr:MBL fold metallo-hydrolase [Silvibacterium sp.]